MAITLREKMLASSHAILSLFGERGLSLQFPGDLLLLEWVLSENPYIRNIVELGTLRGLTTLYLAQAAAIRGGAVDTFDVNDPDGRFIALWPGCVQFHHLDVLECEQPKVVAAVRRPNSLVLLDNGNKPREMELYAKYMGANSVLCVHDFQSEVNGQCDWAKIVGDARLTPYLWDEAEEWLSRTRCWRR